MIRLTTDRLLIREAEPGDADRMAAYALANRQFHRDSSPLRDDDFYTGERQREISGSGDSTCRRFLLFEKDADPRSADIIGSISFSQIAMGAFRSCFLGYGMDRRYAGRGLMTEALTVCLEYMFDEEGLHRVQANVMPANAASIRLLEKLGFRKEGIHERYLKINGRWEDHLSYARLNLDD